MARLKVDGLDQVMGDLNRREGRLHSIITEALNKSAEVLKEQLLDEEADSFVDPSGELGDTLVISPVGHAAGASIIDVYADGTYVGRRGKPRRAGMVAAMVEYKHKNPWNARARRKSSKRINSIIADALRGE